MPFILLFPCLHVFPEGRQVWHRDAWRTRAARRHIAVPFPRNLPGVQVADGSVFPVLGRLVGGVRRRLCLRGEMYVFVGVRRDRLQDALLPTLSFRLLLSHCPTLAPQIGLRTTPVRSRTTPTVCCCCCCCRGSLGWRLPACLPRPFPTTTLPTPTTPSRPAVTFWTWYTTTAYFFLSSASAYLCWRAIGDRTLPSNEVATTATRNPVPSLLERLQLVAWNVACVASLVVVTLYWFADVSKETVARCSAGCFI